MEIIQLNTETGATRITVGEKLLSQPSALPDTRLVFISDENVYRYHRQLFANHPVLLVPSGEKAKTLATVERLCRELVELEADRKTVIIGVGGGLACDVAGFAASVYMRGLSFGFVSTTLLGQVDASVGGKNGVNLDGYKNMIGSFTQPAFVLCDLSLLDTLPENEYISGMAEVIKYAAISSEDLMQLLEKEHAAIVARDKAVLKDVVSACVRIKAGIVEEDETEQGNRKLLNFGHTIGHAVEKLSGVLHGHAVSIGMNMAAKMSVNRGLMKKEEMERLTGLLRKYKLPVDCKLEAGQVYEAMKKDKKRQGDRLNFILLDRIGNAVITPIEIRDFKSELHDLCQHQ